MSWIRVFAPATIGNIGPGFDVLGLAIKGLGDTVEARKIDKGIRITSIQSPTRISRDAKKNTAGIAATEVLRTLHIKSGVELRIKKGIPAGSGLGSSAASAVAAAYATNALYGSQLSRQELILPATRAEEAVSGGFFADNTAPALLGGATVTRSCLPLDVTRIGSIDKMKIVVVTPTITILTKDARKILPSKVSLDAFVSNMANACLISAAFAANNYKLFARSLEDHVIEPVRATLIPGFQAVKQAALAAGADGMAISGSGPTVFTVTDSTRKARFIEDAMVRTFRKCGIDSTSHLTKIDSRGTRVVKKT